LREDGLRFLQARAIVSNPDPQNTAAGTIGLFSGVRGFAWRSPAVLPAVCIVATTVCAPLVPVSVTVDGWKLHVAFCGRFAQANCSVPEYPATGVMVSVSVTD
jgi:hypothetical protein